MDVFLLDSLAARFKHRLANALTLARTDRFVQELEPSTGDEPDVFADLAASFKAWRRALREEDTEASLDAMEAAWTHLEVCRRRVAARDEMIQAFRVRWAGENAALSYPTIDSLARYYRLLPCTTSSQSKYEYILTRRLAGPLSPDRWLPPTGTLLDAVVALETEWGAPPMTVNDAEAADIDRIIRAFGQEATEQEDAASFIAAAMLRRYGAFKASLREKLFDPRLSVAVVETNVKVLNILNQLLAAAGGGPLRGAAPPRRAALPPSMRPSAGDESPLASLSEPFPPPPAAPASEPEEPAPFIRTTRPQPAPSEEVRARPQFQTSEIDVSGLETLLGRPLAPPAAHEPKAPEEKSASEPSPPPGEPSPAPLAPFEGDAGPKPAARSDLSTGEVDLSGLEFVRNARRARAEALNTAVVPGEVSKTASAPAVVDGVTEAAAPGVVGADAEAAQGSSERPVDAYETEQRPSPRAAELGRVESNAALIESYMTRPRSPEVWRLNLDSFLSGPRSEGPRAQGYADERRRAFGLILASDDLICLRETQEGAPTPEHRARVKEVAQSMLRLQATLRRAAGLEDDPVEQEPLLYVSDHLLWERLRLAASLKRNPVLKRPPLMPRSARTTDAVRRRGRTLRRHRRILYWVVGSAAVMTLIVSMMGSSAPRAAVDQEVRLIPLQQLPEPVVFVDARAFRTRLFITADLSWSRLGREERLAIVRAVGAFAAERGLDTVSVVGPRGEALASFKDNEVLLDTDLVVPPRTRR